MTAPKTPPRSSAKNLVLAKSPEHVPEPSTPRNMYQASQKKRFSIKGLLSGESKKERQARQKAEEMKASASKSPAKVDTEADTVYQVDVDDRTISVMSNETKTTAATNDKAVEGFLEGGSKSYMLKVVLLLMDPETRRFELLQLEFDSDKALVSDVLTQIPVAVTEEVLKKQTYVGICGAAGSEMSSAILLSDFCKGNDVLVAVPAGVEASDCARLAKPILNDAKVINMLKVSGIDASSWKQMKKVSPAPSSKPREMPIETPKETTKKEAGGSNTFILIFMVLAAVILQVYHSKITAPIEPGQVLSPGGWISKCGLAAAIPPLCENQYLQMGDDGVLSLFDANGDLEWKMEGGVCKNEACISGLEMIQDSHVVIGGKTVSWVNVKKNADPISPWPFAEQPKLKVIHARK
ncbi:expressed unknown protein [Seminavis robusta]|uniref:Uncharacterized protein n=1 Tax=Seminavis robusta TaxID=568900 RepID=A0A9N8EPM5_9STRA|nr:expressed unknown protein [Seminavis robusta]CAB9524976.1 expressed unknown protein [Seminavis robusta]|eukprot:Sro1515_g279060.1 n/a (409) ;mRNA; f:25510-26891